MFLSDNYIQEHAGILLDGETSSVFFMNSETGEIITPELEHPVISPFTIKPSVMRDSIIVWVI
jgi:hypothetical protein